MKDGYEQSMDQGVVLLEMYAEMMELAVTNPDSTYDNKEVIAGIEEVISAISGENITIEQIREIVNNPSEQVRKRNEEEILLIQEINSGEPSEHEYESISPGEKVKIQTERGEEEQDLDDFTSFVRTGEVPDDMVSDPEIKKVLEQYAQAVSTVHSRHHGALYASNEFDPWLNLWEIQEIEQATDHVFIRGILENPGAIGDSEIADVKVRTDLLRAFINSGAF